MIATVPSVDDLVDSAVTEVKALWAIIQRADSVMKLAQLAYPHLPHLDAARMRDAIDSYVVARLDAG